MTTLVSTHFSTGLAQKTIARMSPQQLGTWGEDYAMQVFTARGYTARPARKSTTFDMVNANRPVWRGDIDVECSSVQMPWPVWSVSVEVKVARPHYYSGKPRWSFGLYKARKTNHKKAHLTMLIALDAADAYIYLFTSDLLDAHIFTLSSHPLKYRGRMYPFLMPDNFTLPYMQSVVRSWLA